jgi:hypothetical protein
MINSFLQEPLRNAEGGGGGGAAAAPAADPATAPPASATPGSTPPAGGAPAAAAAAADRAGQARQETGDAAATQYWPEGLDPQYRGKDLNDTLDKLAAGLKGYRERDATRDVPETADGYANLENLKDVTIEPQNVPYVEALRDDPAFKAMSAAMHRHGLGRTAALDIYQAGLNAMAEAGMLEPAVDTKAEMAALVPESARNASEQEQRQQASRRMQENFDFMALMKQNGGLDAEVASYAEAMLGDAAKGHRFIEWVRGKVQGGKAEGGAPGDVAGRSGGDTRGSLRAEMAALKPNDPDYAAKDADITRRYQALYGN